MIRSKYKYVRPQSEVYQLLEVTLAAVRDHLAACIVASQYDLYRYGKEDITPIPYEAKGGTYAYKYEMSPLYDYKVDVASVNVYAEGLEAYYTCNKIGTRVADWGADFYLRTDKSEWAFQLEERDYLAMRVSDNLKKAGKPYLLAAYTGMAKRDLLPELKGYSVQVGDIVRVATTPEDYRPVDLPPTTNEGWFFPLSETYIPEEYTGIVVGEQSKFRTETHIMVKCVKCVDEDLRTEENYWGLKDSKWQINDTAGVFSPEELAEDLVMTLGTVRVGGKDKDALIVHITHEEDSQSIDVDVEDKDAYDLTFYILTEDLVDDPYMNTGTYFTFKVNVHEPMGKWNLREVTELLGERIPAEVDDPIVESVHYNTYPDGTFFIAEEDKHAYTAVKDTTYVITCVANGVEQGITDVPRGFRGSRWKVTDTSDVDVYTYFIDMPYDAKEDLQDVYTVNIGRYHVKLSIRMDANHGQKVRKCAVGDQITIFCAANKASTTRFDGVKLTAAPGDINTILQQKMIIVDDAQTMENIDLHDAADIEKYAEKRGIYAVKFGKRISGNILQDDELDAAWTADENGITVEPNMALFLQDRTDDYFVSFADGIGVLYPEFRVQVIPADVDEEMFMVRNDDEVQQYFGTIAPDNELAYACSCALRGAAGREVYALRTRGTDVDAFMAAVKKTEADTYVYSFAPITTDYKVMKAVVDFNYAMSEPDVKHWRRTIVGVEFPGAYILAKDDFDDKILKANLVYYNGGFNLIQLNKSVNFSFKEIAYEGADAKLNPGDLIQFGAGQKYPIKAVISDRELLLAEDYRAPLQQVPIKLWKADTPANNAEYITGIARRFNTRRALVVWTDRGTTIDDDDTIVVPNKFLAAEIAGLSSAVVPQQGITHSEITSIRKATRMYTQYTQLQLDDIASQGVLIVTQDTKETPCYIRHQLTTEMDKGNLYWEDSCTRNIDNISYAIVDVIDPFIGRANVTPSALRKLKADIEAKLNEFMLDSPNDLIGPSLINWDTLIVKQDEKFLDRVNVWVNLYLPLPMNNIRMYEMGYVARVEI